MYGRRMEEDSDASATSSIMMDGSGPGPAAGPVIPAQVDAARDRFPYCVTWSPLPCISWFLPFIGHTGIASSAGVTYDFAGPYTINEGHMAFGRATKYWQLSPAAIRGMDWDAAVREANGTYSKRMHNLFCDNCHSHVARALNNMAYEGRTNYTMGTIGWKVFLHGRYTSQAAAIKTWLPFLIIVAIVLLAVLLT